MLSKFKSVKRNVPKQQYCQEIEELCHKLTSSYIKEEIPHVTAKRLATKAAIYTLINIVPSDNAKIVLQAGKFTSIEEAIQKLNEMPDSDGNRSTAQILSMNRGNKRLSQGRGYNNQRGNWRQGYRNITDNITVICAYLDMHTIEV